MMNLHESLGPGRDQTLDPWICSQAQPNALRCPVEDMYILRQLSCETTMTGLIYQFLELSSPVTSYSL